MNYPLFSEYIDAIKSAEDNFEELTNLRPVLSDDGEPVMTSGNCAVVFKMEAGCREMNELYTIKKRQLTNEKPNLLYLHN